MGLCVNLFTVDKNFEMGPRWIFLLMVNFLLMFTNFMRTCFHLSQVYLCLICNGRETEREKVCEREERGEREEITSLKKTSSGKVWRFFLRFHHFFPMKYFPDQNNLSPTKKSPCRKFYPTNTISEDTLIYVRKSFKNDIRIEVRIKIHFNYCFTVQALIEVGNGKIAKC